MEPFIVVGDRCKNAIEIAQSKTFRDALESHPDRQRFSALAQKSLRFFRSHFRTSELSVNMANNQTLDARSLVDSSDDWSVTTCKGALAVLMANLAEETAHEDEAFERIKGPQFAWRSFAAFAALSTTRAGADITCQEIEDSLRALREHLEMPDLLSDDDVEQIASDSLCNDDGGIIERVAERWLLSANV